MFNYHANTIYMDHAAATPTDPIVAAAMLPYIQNTFANPSSLYAAARETRAAIDTARASIANNLGSKPTEIVFTSGGTEGNNLAIQGVLRRFTGAHWVTTAIEHDSVLAIAEPYRSYGHPCTIIPVRPNGIIEPTALDLAITDNTVLISVMLANNEIGTIQPIARVAKLVASIRADRVQRAVMLPLYFHTDAVQAANYLDLHVTRLGVDLLTLSASKVYGPKGVGTLYIRHGTNFEPMQYGGGQERGRRSGTENVAGIVGMSKALEIAVNQRVVQAHQLTSLRDELAEKILAAIEGIVINGDLKRRLPNSLNLTIAGVDGEALILYLDNAGIMASTGSACSTGNLEPSHVLLAIGRTATQANASLRLTLGRNTTPKHIETVATTLKKIVERLRNI